MGSTSDIEWVKQEIGSLAPLQDPSEIPLYSHSSAQGGFYQSFLNLLIQQNNLTLLRRFEARGLPLHLSAYDLLKAISSDSSRCLPYVLERLSAPGEVMERIRNRFPKFEKNQLEELKAESKVSMEKGEQEVKTPEYLKNELEIKKLEEKLKLACEAETLKRCPQQNYDMQPLEYKAKSLALEWRIFALNKNKCPLHLKAMIILSDVSGEDITKWNRLMKKHLSKLNEEFPNRRIQ